MKILTRADAARFLLEHDHFAILSHRRPDGDTVGTSAALCRGLRLLGKTAHVLVNKEVTPRFAWLHEGLTKPWVEEGDTIVSVDVASPEMLPADFRPLLGKIALRIDHHSSATSFTEQELVDGDSASCAEVVWDVLELMGVKADRALAEAVYVGVSTDTGCFQYSNTSAASFRAAAELLRLGADNSMVSTVFFRKVSRARLKLESMIYSGLQYFRDGKIAVAAITLEMMEKAGATEDDCDDLAGLAGRVEGSILNITIREQEDGSSKISVRSTPEISSSDICAVFGGGGHAMAAGCTIYGKPDKARDMLLSVIDEVWK